MCWKNLVPWSHLSRRFEGPSTLEGQRLAALASCSLKVEAASPYLASFLSLAESFRGGMDRPSQAAAALLRMRNDAGGLPFVLTAGDTGPQKGPGWAIQGAGVTGGDHSPPRTHPPP